MQKGVLTLNFAEQVSWGFIERTNGTWKTILYASERVSFFKDYSSFAMCQHTTVFLHRF